jgi:uncharacterized protein (TIGR03083 family)
MSTVALFTRSADAFVEVVRRVPDDAWDGPGLDDWTVRSLVGHTTRAILTVEQYLHLDDPEEISIPTAERYYTTVYAQFTDRAAVSARAVEAGVWLGDDPLQRIREALSRTRSALETAPANRVVPIGGMGIPLDEYLRTRVFELVVHSSDIARAVHIEHEPPIDALRACATLAVSTGIEAGHGIEILAALTGRGALSEGYSVV